MLFLEPGIRFRNIFLLESRAWLVKCRASFDPARDLVLTFDFALKHEVEQMGGTASYVDHLLDNQAMQANNFLAYEFLRKWHYDTDGKDVFTYAGVPFGFSLRLYIWSELLFYVRTRLCLETLRELKFDSLFAGTQLGIVESILEEMGAHYCPVAADAASTLPRYYFPIHDWTSENIGRRGWKARFSSLLTWTVGSLLSTFDRFLSWQSGKPAVFVQFYHPTAKLTERLKQDARVRVLGLAISKSFLRNLRQSRYVPLWSRLRRFQPIAQELLGKLRAKRCAKLVSADGVEISEGAYATIHKHLSGHMAESLRTLDCMIRYLGRNPIDLEVMISNVGGINGLVDCVAKARGIPSYLIINGYLSGDFLDEAKYATVINAYAPSIKENYFRGMGNVICLGDPRMDAYPPRERPRTFDKESFTVTIGASGFNNIDLNSYVAVEFEFMFDVLQALSMVKKSGVDVRVVIKVRPNGYASQYRQFSNEYFPDIVDEILDAIPMKDVLERSDLYISIYSQTVFEASCLGVRCIYYKKDDEIVNPPFDRRSELVTVGSVDDLVEALSDFRSGHSRFDAFLQRSVMEKYIGPLDGGNVERNLNFIYEMLDKSVAKRVG